MFSSLRARLWISYIFLIGIALSLVAVGIFVSLRQTPILYRQTLLRLRLASAVITQKIEPALLETRQDLQLWLEREANNRDLWLAILRSTGNVLANSGDYALPQAILIGQPASSTNEALESYRFRDPDGKTWLYILNPIGRDYFLFVATLQPRLPLRAIFTDEILRPVIRSGIVALFAAFLLGIALARWISSPIEKIVGVTRKISKGQSSEIDVSGPAEVQKLAGAFKEMIASVEASQRSQREFVSNVSHELRTPLTSIQGFSQAILDGTAREPEALHHAVRVINSEAGRLQRLANGLLDLARLEAGTADFQPGMVDLSELLGGIVEKLAPQIQAKNLVVTLLTGKLPKIYGDGDRLAQVFFNLLDNAIKFTPPGGKIELTTGILEDVVSIRVADSGPGISLEDQKRIFERFYQVEKSRRGGADRGIGLGLPIAQQIVIAHGGQILLESSPEQGAIFTVQIPVHRANL